MNGPARAEGVDMHLELSIDCMLVVQLNHDLVSNLSNRSLRYDSTHQYFLQVALTN